MALPLTTSDFRLRQVTCEIRFPNAFLIFDNTGKIYHQLSKQFKNLHADSGAPMQTQMTADEGVIVVEHQALRLTDNKPDSKLEMFASNFKILLDAAGNNLDLLLFTRIGLRQIFIKNYSNANEAENALNSVRLTNMGTQKRFGIGPNITEFIVRWQDKELGASFRFKSETATVDAEFSPDLGLAEPSIHKEIHRLVIDVDYYTVANVERDQWDPSIWITQSARIVRKEVDGILSL